MIVVEVVFGDVSYQPQLYTVCRNENSNSQFFGSYLTIFQHSNFDTKILRECYRNSSPGTINFDYHHITSAGYNIYLHSKYKYYYFLRVLQSNCKHVEYKNQF